jgi:MFS transporter, DHA1 family, multidrug resistance protein
MKKSDQKTFSILFFSIFTAVTGVGIVVPLLPVYAKNMGASGLYIGLIFGSFSLSRTFFLPLFGKWSDKKGRRPFITAGLFSYVLVSLAFLLSSDVNTLIVIRFLQGIASAMMMPVLQAYVGDITPRGKEGFIMGLFNFSMFMGLSIGPLAGGVLNDRFSLNAAFAAMAVLSFVGFLLSFFLLPPTREERCIIRKKKPVPWKIILKDREISGLFLFRFAYAACIGIVWGFLPVMADTRFSLSSLSIGVLVMMGVFISGLLHVPMGYLADRINRRMMLTTGGLIVAMALFLYNRTGGVPGLMTASILFGIGGGISMPALMALTVIKGDQTGSMGSVLAIITLAHSLGMLTGSLLAGAMMDLFTLDHAFYMGSGIMAIAAIYAHTIPFMETAAKPDEKPGPATTFPG